MEILNRQNRDSLRDRYREDKLFKAWSHPLKTLEHEMGLPAPEVIWQATEKMHVRLRDLGDDAPYEIDYIFTDWEEELKESFKVTRGEAAFIAAVILTVLLSQLSAAKPHEGENPNRGCCRALARILCRDEFVPVVGNLLKMLKEEKTDLNGRKLVVPVQNYLNEAENGKLLSASTQKAIDQMVDIIVEKTKGLGYYLLITKESYRAMWTEILSLPDMLDRIRKVSPNKNAWGMNQKMVANVLGMMMQRQKVTDNATKVAELLNASNMRNYLRNHADFDGSGSAFTEAEHKTVDAIIKTKKTKLSL